LNKFEDILVQCIEDIKAGRSSIEDCLDRYSSMREQLEPLLKIALEIREPPDIKPSAAFKVKTRVWLMDQIHGGQAAARWPWSRYDGRIRPMPYIKRFGTSMAGVILAVVLAVSGLGVGAAYASQSSLPGDTLYPLKLATEQAGMILSPDGPARAERALSFANKRMREMEALTQKGRSQDLELAVEQYGYALNMTLAMIEQTADRGLATENITALVAEATVRHLMVLDELWDMVPEEAKAAIAQARNVSETGRENALMALARNNTVWATELNLASMEGRLTRIRARVQNAEAVQIALQQFEGMGELGEEICRIGQATGLDMTDLEELIAEATARHLEVLAEVWEEAPEQARPAIERVMANLMMRYQNRVQAWEQKGIGVPPAPVIPERIRERIEERIREQEQWEGDGTTVPGQGVLAGAGQQNGHGTT
jgi:predicted transcriptional regulator